MKINAVMGGDLLFEDEGAEPVSTAEIKAWIRVPDAITADDTLIAAVGKAARIMLERYCSISFITRSITCTMINELNNVELPFGPVTDIVSIENEDGDALAEGEYELIGQEFKRVKTDCKLFTVTYTAGYATLPENLKLAIKKQAAWLYEHRGDEREGRLDPLLAMELKQVKRNMI